MSQPNWYIVLNRLYESDGRVQVWEKFDDSGADLTDEFWSETKLSSDEILDAMAYLDEAGLIHDGIEGVGLTNDGFKAIYERRDSQTQTGLNRGLVALTTILALGSIVQTAVDISQAQEPSYFIILLLGGETIVFAAIYVEMYRRGLLDFDY
ncbi:hypothetical protein [Haloarcula marina]|uniref:hypothetical protein n=1 Tax=Haloarcula marina TaxID=2961574 RepID=UPI0020B7D820|nr:hypothetical protein [Halomicroarcula marina]